MPEPSPICGSGIDNAVNSIFGLVFIVSRYLSTELVYFFGKFVLIFEEFNRNRAWSPQALSPSFPF